MCDFENIHPNEFGYDAIANEFMDVLSTLEGRCRF